MGTTLNWIQEFLSNRELCIIINGTHSSWKTAVRSGVPQGYVLGPTLFLLYINDITDEVKSTMRFFCWWHHLISRKQMWWRPKPASGRSKHRLAWADKWQMSFNASKYQLLTITRKTKPKLHLYTVSDQAIESTSHHKYLDVTISSNLTWKKHIASITYKTSSTIDVIRRNLGPCSSNVKLRAHQALVRPQLEYGTAAWNPYAEGDIKLLEAIQRQAVRFICGEYGRWLNHHLLLSSRLWLFR